MTKNTLCVLFLFFALSAAQNEIRFSVSEFPTKITASMVGGAAKKPSFIAAGHGRGREDEIKWHVKAIADERHKAQVLQLQNDNQISAMGRDLSGKETPAFPVLFLLHSPMFAGQIETQEHTKKTHRPFRFAR